MHSFRAVYDVNSTGNPFEESVNEPSQLPHDVLNQFAGLHTPSDAPLPINPVLPTTLHQLASFFRPRSTPAVHTIPKDNNIFGDTMIIPSPSNTTRLYFINLNGLNLQKKAAKFRDLCEEMRNANVDLFAAAEHNLGTNKFAVRQSLQV
jgi:hypothetical protein